ncbi:MAG TPA: hypothetical protein VK204_03680, partial [Nocardioidaceae bacterium]|nr:hypothetical protein [Nocardioidaceae bacterium]
MTELLILVLVAALVALVVTSSRRQQRQRLAVLPGEDARHGVPAVLQRLGHVLDVLGLRRSPQGLLGGLVGVE